MKFENPYHLSAGRHTNASSCDGAQQEKKQNLFFYFLEIQPNATLH